MKKFYLSFISCALLSIVMLGWLIDTFSQHTHQTKDEFSVQSKLIAGFSKQLANVPTSQREHFVTQLANDFKLQLDYKANSTLALPPSLLLQMHSADGLILQDKKGFYMLYSDELLHPYHLNMRLDKVRETQQRNDVLLTLIFYSGLCLLMGFIVYPLSRRLTVLNNTAKAFATGNTQARIKVSHFTYIKDVELTFNKMASQIEKLVAENKLIASSLSHDIRTPIACLRFGVDAALATQDVKKIKQYLFRMETDLDQMESMLKSYLAFATLEQNANKLTYSTTNINDYIEQIVQQLSPKVNAEDLKITVSACDADIEADLHWLARAITNLISNACDFARTQIHINIKINDYFLVISVEDDGPGVDKENFKNVFSPFFKEQTHRNRSNQSYGLGLAIVNKVADWHQGKVCVEQSKRLKGACFKLYIALNKT
ncbi:HAMP domain-containing histidine kinase [Pseudoalteromonas sp. MMG010]|uniref:sensor histidine kinase n=1 Tax=Pseudoalteromonas sp. MMG010 TaxID=2822685 RepID=UPI001B3A7B1F|nr:HAMP domain-containing sensor histidine kinase [Pseudoalteromonas sp. MMG010]MBQ4831724.1 HAMP domain-containing histidine kinase [Pseudoalteromonas sp. MMG010]